VVSFPNETNPASPSTSHTSLATNERQHGSAIRALELIGKELGMFVDRKEITNRYESMTDQEIDAELARIERLLAGIEAGRTVIN
jgi:hypothetical protein